MSGAHDPLEVDDAIVLLLGAPSNAGLDGQLEGITRLEKLVFLLERETSARNWLGEDADFEPYDFGPFSSKVYQAIDTLSAAQIIEGLSASAKTSADNWEQYNVIGERMPADDPYITRSFQLTDRGWRYYSKLVEQLPDGAIDELVQFKNRFARLPLRQLVRYVYQRYKDFTHESVIRDDVPV